jgi:formylglycine-generating enzyme
MPQPHYIFTDPPTLQHLSEMIFVEGGIFRMGREKGHLVKLDSFYIGKYPVTQALWKAVMKGENPSHFIGDNRPVESISWDDAQDFIRKLYGKTGVAYRLPTEAEWEYAAQGGKYWEQFPFKYSGSDKLNEVGWYDENSHDETKPVGLKTPNLLGIYDMSGNVWEWCEDKYGSYEDVIKASTKDPVTNAIVNPTGVVEGSIRVLRGGSWFNSSEACRPTYRINDPPTNSRNDVGFRLVLFSPSV